ncbi:MAG: flavin reductase family protein [Acholeplasmataceae bacterium]|nr:flavin reductase family protein [Acholeplasmataceae bacterium]
MKREINVLNHATEIIQGLEGGVLLTTKADGKVNSMTISWGTLGIEWHKPIFITFVREGRFTRTQLDKNAEFTVNIPYGAYDKNILAFCGTQSGRTTDKIKELGLTLESPLAVSAPGIKELPLTLECKVIYKQKQDLQSIAPENQVYYPQDVDGSFHGTNKNVAIAYYGEIVRAYFIE